MIIQKGSEQDKANLPEETQFNQGHTGRKRRGNLQGETRVARRRAPNSENSAVAPPQLPLPPQPPSPAPSIESEDSFVVLAEIPPARMPI